MKFKLVILAIVAAVGLALSLQYYRLLTASQDEKTLAAFRGLCENQARLLRDTIDDNVLILKGLRSFYSSSTHVDRAEFASYCAPLLAENLPIKSLDWIPCVRREERLSYEEQARREGLPKFTFLERDEEMRMVPARERPEYFPVYYREPLAATEKALGFDTASDSRRWQTMALARDSGQPTASGEVVLINDDQPGVLILVPIYRGGALPTTLEERRARLAGFVRGVLRLESLRRHLKHLADIPGLHFDLHDMSEGDESLLADPAARPSGRAAWMLERDQEMLGRSWRFHFWADSEFTRSHESRAPFFALVAGVLITCVVAGGLGISLIYVHRVESDVSLRTRELAEVNAKLLKARDDAEAAGRAKTAFFSNVSHELRTPLNAILGFAQILEKEGGLPGHLREYVRTIHQSGRHLLDLINDVIDMARLESRRLKVERETMDIRDLLQNLHRMFSLSLADKNVRFEISVAAETPRYISADARRLRQVLINLIGNAVKFTERGTITLAVMPDQRERRLHFAVADTGRGIPAGDLAAIFEPFQQVEGTRGEGSGLGLPISRDIVRLMGGDLEVESRRGEGSRFFFDIPLEGPEADEAARLRAAESAGELPLATLRALALLPENLSQALREAAATQNYARVLSLLEQGQPWPEQARAGLEPFAQAARAGRYDFFIALVEALEGGAA